MRSYYRNPRTMQERRANGKRSKWARAKRNKALATLVDWNKHHGYQKSWKKKRKTQYRVGGRGQEYRCYIDRDDIPHNHSYWNTYWDLEEYFKEHNIPFQIKADYDIHIHKELITTKRVCVSSKQCSQTFCGRIFYWTKHEWGDEPVKPYVKIRKSHTLKGFKVTWWTNKKLDLSEFGLTHPESVV
jgi:hypothetical protein